MQSSPHAGGIPLHAVQIRESEGCIVEVPNIPKAAKRIRRLHRWHNS